jgi:hypothetical protein
LRGSWQESSRKSHRWKPIKRLLERLEGFRKTTTQSAVVYLVPFKCLSPCKIWTLSLIRTQRFDRHINAFGKSDELSRLDVAWSSIGNSRVFREAEASIGASEAEAVG